MAFVREINRIELRRARTLETPEDQLEELVSKAQTLSSSRNPSQHIVSYWERPTHLQDITSPSYSMRKHNTTRESRTRYSKLSTFRKIGNTPVHQSSTAHTPMILPRRPTIAVQTSMHRGYSIYLKLITFPTDMPRHVIPPMQSN